MLKTYRFRKLQLHISDHIQSVRDDLMARLRQIEALIRNAQTVGHRNPDDIISPVDLEISPVTPPEAQPRRASAPVSQNLTTGRLGEKFEETMRHHPRFRSILPEIPIEDWCEAAAWWIESVRIQFLLPKQNQ